MCVYECVVDMNINFKCARHPLWFAAKNNEKLQLTYTSANNLSILFFSLLISLHHVREHAEKI